MDIIILIIFGLAMGSFINALVWRLHEKRDFVKERSVCEHCNHTLDWYDLVPLISYFSLRGQCRYCNKKISVKNPLVELAMAGVYSLSFIYWPNELNDANTWSILILFLGITSVLVGLFLYDIAWLELPDKLMKTLYLLVFVSLLLISFSTNDLGSFIKDSIFGILIGGGFFYGLYQFSSGKWIGGGDVKFGFTMGAYVGALGSLIALLVAFYSSAIFILPLMLSGKVNRKSKVPFGPFLIIGFYAVSIWGDQLSNLLKNWLSY
jgi:prepilin signal peptidase PulO-like enzyme (type II secretory pathway)